MLESLEAENQLMLEALLKLKEEKEQLTDTAQAAGDVRRECKHLGLEVQRLKSENESGKMQLLAIEEAAAKEERQLRGQVERLLSEREAGQREAAAREMERVQQEQEERQLRVELEQLVAEREMEEAAQESRRLSQLKEQRAQSDRLCGLRQQLKELRSERFGPLKELVTDTIESAGNGSLAERDSSDTTSVRCMGAIRDRWQNMLEESATSAHGQDESRLQASVARNTLQHLWLGRA